MYVKITNLTFCYRGTKSKAISNVSLTMEKGEILAIRGASGSGKSTLLRLISGIEVPTSGTIEIDRYLLTSDHAYVPPEKRNIGMVFQDYALFPHMTVVRNIQYGLRKMSQKQRMARTEEMLDLISLQGYEHRYPYELSGGQQQRVALARALAPKPSLLLLDEPFSNLDANLQQKIRSELRTIIKDTGTTSIFVTHDDEDAKAIADHVLHLQSGRIKQQLAPVFA